MFEEKDKKEKFAKNYWAAVAHKEEAESIKRDQVTSLLLIEDSGQNTEKSRKALSIAKDNVEIAERRIEKKLEALRVLIAREVDDELKGLDRKFEELKTTSLDQVRAAGVAVGQAESFFTSLGPEFSPWIQVMQRVAADFKARNGTEPDAFMQGYRQGKSKDIQNINQLKSHYNHLKRIKIYKTDRDQFEYKKLHRTLRQYAN